MNAYLYAMLLIFANAGVFMMSMLGVFGSRINTFDFFAKSVGEIPPQYLIGGTIVLAVVLAAGTASLVGTKIVSAQGVAYVAFSLIFWAAFGTAFSIIAAIPFTAIGLIILPVFFGINVLVFIMALLQMASGGFKTHD